MSLNESVQVEYNSWRDTVAKRCVDNRLNIFLLNIPLMSAEEA